MKIVALLRRLSPLHAGAELVARVQALSDHGHSKEAAEEALRWLRSDQLGGVSREIVKGIYAREAAKLAKEKEELNNLRL